MHFTPLSIWALHCGAPRILRPGQWGRAAAPTWYCCPPGDSASGCHPGLHPRRPDEGPVNASADAEGPPEVQTGVMCRRLGLPVGPPRRSSLGITTLCALGTWLGVAPFHSVPQRPDLATDAWPGMRTAGKGLGSGLGLDVGLAWPCLCQQLRCESHRLRPAIAEAQKEVQARPVQCEGGRCVAQVAQASTPRWLPPSRVLPDLLPRAPPHHWLICLRRSPALLVPR